MALHMNPNTQGNIEKGNQSMRHHNSWLELLLKAVINTTVLYWHRNRHIDQFNRIDNPELDPQMYGQVIFDKVGNSVQ